ncbi:diguanylate cyclase [Thiomicrospira sp. XS5]|uniref:putative bifunctional diguanylate cyclase/phosphodiesterase n=1 Tax=Thiomicrospira sp. XS5 TaxID=1775636 RepID=UPI00074630EC|nr:EAL domain-containing protein [Thiomicrospira sp. XS5]KUJ73950.1 diguanylate cyclase [Thiomicrospira sp. XS5]
MQATELEERHLKALKLSHQQTLEIINRFEQGVILFTADADPILFNETVKRYYPELESSENVFDDIALFTQKHQGHRFELKTWLRQLHQNIESPHQQVWLKSPQSKTSIPVRLQAYWIDLHTTPHILLIVSDQTLHTQVTAQRKLMEASYAGQFVTNAQGYILHPNLAFSGYTGLTQTELNRMTYIDWLRQQVSFKVPFEKVISALLKEHFWTGEVQIHASEENVFYAVLSLSMILDAEKNIEHFVGLLQDTTDIRAAQTEIQQLAYFDKLTGLPNQTLLHDRIERLLQQTDSETPYHALYLISLDGFKSINDTFGHCTGDQLLLQVAHKLKQTLPEQATLARMGGGNFSVLYPSQLQDEALSKQDIARYSEALLELIDDRYKLEDGSVHTSASIGICPFALNDAVQYDSDQLTRHTNMAMYEAKKLGGNQAYLFEDTLMQRAKRRLELIEALNHSELDDEFQMYFQPQVNREGRVVSAETLLRWFHPTLGLVSPAKFIPVAEEGRQIIKIGLWVLHKAFLQARAWNAKYCDIRIAINVSPVQFHEQSFIEMIIGLIKFTQVNPHNITLELTEGVLIKNAKLALQKIQHLVSLGFEVSIDDFGTGYSSLSYLQKLPLHELKIDKSFISDVPGNIDDEAIITSIVQLAASKQLKIVAEGVETQAQADYLNALYPEILQQGYLYGKPLPADEFEEKFVRPQANNKTA